MEAESCHGIGMLLEPVMTAEKRPVTGQLQKVVIGCLPKVVIECLPKVVIGWLTMVVIGPEVQLFVILVFFLVELAVPDLYLEADIEAAKTELRWQAVAELELALGLDEKVQQLAAKEAGSGMVASVLPLNITPTKEYDKVGCLSCCCPSLMLNIQCKICNL